METKVPGRLILSIAIRESESTKNIVEIRIVDWM